MSDGPPPAADTPGPDTLTTQSDSRTVVRPLGVCGTVWNQQQQTERSGAVSVRPYRAGDVRGRPVRRTAPPLPAAVPRCWAGGGRRPARWVAAAPARPASGPRRRPRPACSHRHRQQTARGQVTQESHVHRSQRDIQSCSQESSFSAAQIDSVQCTQYVLHRCGPATTAVYPPSETKAQCTPNP